MLKREGGWGEGGAGREAVLQSKYYGSQIK